MVCPVPIAWCGERVIRRVTRPTEPPTMRVQRSAHNHPAKPVPMGQGTHFAAGADGVRHAPHRLRTRAGQDVLIFSATMPRDTALRRDLCADSDGFSRRAVVSRQAPDRKRLAQLCRYTTRPAPASKCV